MESHTYDVAIIAGGAGDLSAALVLARARRQVVVLDAGSPRNAPAAHMHNRLSRDRLPPAELLALGRAEILGYGAEIVPATVVRVQTTSTVFEVVLENACTVAARRVLLATGLTDSCQTFRVCANVLHCPYCHGCEQPEQRADGHQPTVRGNTGERIGRAQNGLEQDVSPYAHNHPREVDHAMVIAVFRWKFEPRRACTVVSMLIAPQATARFLCASADCV